MKHNVIMRVLATLLACVMLISSLGAQPVSVAAPVLDSGSDVAGPVSSNTITTSSTTIYVPDNYPTIQAAVNAAGSGATIIVRAGTYAENIVVSKGGLTIESESGAGVTTVQAASTSSHVFHVRNVNDVRIRGFTIRGATGEKKAGISLDQANSCDISDNVVSNNWAGIGLYMARGNTIHRNTFSNNTYGGGTSEDPGSGGCAVEEAVYGAGIAAEPKVTLDSLRVLRDQELSAAYVDSYYEYSPDVTIILISKPALMFQSAQLISKYMPAVRYVLGQGGQDLEITDEGAMEMVSFLRDLGAAVAEREESIGVARSAEIMALLAEFEDQIRASTDRMFSEAFRDSVYYSGANQATRVAPASSAENVFYLNNFINNSTNARNEKATNTWNSAQTVSYSYKGSIFTGFLGNYWSNYTGSDAYGDGIGDTAYVIDGSNRDNYPLVERFENYAPAPPELARDDARFVVDVTVPDRTEMHPGQEFVKTWRLRNAGTTTWTTDYRLVFDGGDEMGAPQHVNLDALVPPGGTIDIPVPMTAPLTGGARKGYWRMENPAALRFGDTIWVSVFVPHILTSELAEAIDYLYMQTMQRLDHLMTNMETTAEHGDFFRQQVDSQAAALAMTLVLGFLSIEADIAQTAEHAKYAFQLAHPGGDISAGGWMHADITDLRRSYEPAKYLFSIQWSHLFETSTQAFNQEILSMNLMSYAGMALETAAEELGPNEALQWLNEKAGQTDCFSAEFYPSLVSAVEMAQQHLTDVRDELLNSLPSLSQEEQSAYAADLHSRGLAARNLHTSATYTVPNLPAIRGFYEQGWSTRVLLGILKFFARTLASAAFDGPGKLLVDSFLTAWDGYIHGFKLNESQRMVSMAQGLMESGMATSKQLQLNAFYGLRNMQDCLPPQTVTGEIVDISHYSEGYNPWQPWTSWVETGSYSLVTISNDSAGTEPAMFRIAARYLADYSAIFGFGSSILEAAEDVVIVEVYPGETVEGRIDYKSESTGSSPTENGNVFIYVFGSNDSGTFSVDVQGTTWTPQLVSQATGEVVYSSGVTEPGDKIEITDNPVHVFVSASPDDLNYEVETWVVNPVAQNLTVTIAHDISDDWEVLSAPGAQSGNTSPLVWEAELEEGDLVQVSFTFAYRGDLSLDILVPGPIVTLENSEGEFMGEIIGNSRSLKPVLPVAGSVAMPVQVMLHDQATVTVDLHNLSPETTGGDIIVSVTDPAGSCAYNGTQAFTLASSANATLHYLLPAFSEQGLYQVLTEISYAGVSRVMWRDVLRVGTWALGVELDATPADRVYPGDTISYIVTLSNGSDSPLTGVTAQATIPPYTVAHNVTHGGWLEDSLVAWELTEPLPPGGTAELSFLATVMPDVIGPDEARPIKSSAQAASDEAFPAGSNEVRILLAGNPPPVMGTISGDVDLYDRMDNQGVLVTVSGAYIAMTAHDGSFAIDVPAGSHNVSFTYPGFHSAEYENAVVVAGEEVSVPSVLLIPMVSPNRTLPPRVVQGAEFEVMVSFNSTHHAFHGISVTDIAPAGWNVLVDASWTTPQADAAHTPSAEVAAYDWEGPHDTGVCFEVVYKVEVPHDARLGSHNITGVLEYYIDGAGPYEEAIAGDTRLVILPAIIPGDANGDGVVNVLDLALTARIVAGLEDEEDWPGADANQDGKVNVLDLAKMARMVAGIH